MLETIVNAVGELASAAINHIGNPTPVPPYTPPVDLGTEMDNALWRSNLFNNLQR